MEKLEGGNSNSINSNNNRRNINQDNFLNINEIFNLIKESNNDKNNFKGKNNNNKSKYSALFKPKKNYKQNNNNNNSNNNDKTKKLIKINIIKNKKTNNNNKNKNKSNKSYIKKNSIIKRCLSFTNKKSNFYNFERINNNIYINHSKSFSKNINIKQKLGNVNKIKISQKLISTNTQQKPNSKKIQQKSNSKNKNKKKNKSIKEILFNFNLNKNSIKIKRIKTYENKIFYDESFLDYKNDLKTNYNSNKSNNDLDESFIYNKHHGTNMNMNDSDFINKNEMNNLDIVKNKNLFNKKDLDKNRIGDLYNKNKKLNSYKDENNHYNIESYINLKQNNNNTDKSNSYITLNNQNYIYAKNGELIPSFLIRNNDNSMIYNNSKLHKSLYRNNMNNSSYKGSSSLMASYQNAMNSKKLIQKIKAGNPSSKKSDFFKNYITKKTKSSMSNSSIGFRLHQSNNNYITNKNIYYIVGKNNYKLISLPLLPKKNILNINYNSNSCIDDYSKNLNNKKRRNYSAVDSEHLMNSNLNINQSQIIKNRNDYIDDKKYNNNMNPYSIYWVKNIVNKRPNQKLLLQNTNLSVPKIKLKLIKK